jgi:hypothetical protein
MSAGLVVVAVQCLLSGSLQAGEADILGVEVQRSDDGTYTFKATVQHGDTGWEHYADRFDIITSDGRILGTRTLYHPHVDEQPFTRNLTGVLIPGGVNKIIVRARDSVHGYGGKTLEVELPGKE